MTPFDSIRAELLDEYQQNHNAPWVVGYSGGKDSTLVAHLVVDMLMHMAPSDRTRPVHIVANDTLVESPPVAQHMRDSLAEIEYGARAFDLPVVTAITRPEPNQSFWVNLIGRGYPSPNRSFRWCTDRMKIQPTTGYIKSRVADAGQVILLLGVRRAESSARAASIKRHDTGHRLNPHGDMPGCMVFKPIVDLEIDDVWEFLALNEPPWGGSHLKMINLYREAKGGECPVVTSKEDAPSCGTTSSRFGCWTCTVVTKDRSLEGFLDSGYTEYGPLLDFRDWLVSIRNAPERRQARRRNGGYIVWKNNGNLIPGPFTLLARREILDKLRELEKQMGQSLITDEEVDLISRIWSDDLAKMAQVRPVRVRELG
ncbi:MAG: DNA phosphorothioation system sulfurtransferase DndC [Rhodobacteraceae bacterium]|nr:DNA phosphorothioation system sulfurtransferase DndC [Paracoccaceae bacterium]